MLALPLQCISFPAAGPCAETPLLYNRAQGPHQVGADEPDPAVDVKADPSRGHHSFRVAHVKGCHIPNRKAVS